MLQQLGVKTIYAETMMSKDDKSDNVNNNDDDNNNKNSSSQRSERKRTTSIPYYDVEWTHDCTALVIGSEGNGLSTDLRWSLMASDDGDVPGCSIWNNMRG
jgi:hypothetical protein